MSKLKILLLAILPLVFFSGCLQVDTKLNLKQNGSGTIEEIFLMKSSVVNMMKELALAFDSSKTDGFNLFNEEELKAKASNFGEGVKYLSGEKIKNDNYEGFKVIYSFADINKVKINPAQEDKIPFGDELINNEKATSDEYLRFNFKKGNPSTLVINFPKEKENADVSVEEEVTEIEDSTVTSDQMEKLIEMFDGMKILLTINVDKNIQETDASYANGSEITLMNVDFSEIIKHKDILEDLQKNKPETLDSFQKIIGELPGIKIETKEKVIVKF